MLYERHNFLNKNISYLTSREIIEYDIQSAGFNLIKKYGLLEESKIRYLESLEKKQRQIQIGLYQREDKNLIKLLNEKFVEIRKMFFEANDLSDDDVLSIKKDAIITLRRCSNTDFDNVHFIEKNYYTSYYYINSLEIYVGSSTLDIKGISDNKLEKHKDYMIDFLFSIFKMMETTQRDIIIKNVKRFAEYYKNKELDVGYYRELNSDSLFKLKETLFNKPIGIEDVGDVDMIDTSYNYLHYIIPIINLLI